MNRKTFIKQTGLAVGLVAAAPLISTAAAPNTKLVILHTNDVHSRLEPFANDGSRNAGMGGVSARAAIIQQIRSENEHVLLLDAGDIFQGTPFFNFFKGEPEIKAMTAMQYDAATMGNHDFDGGLDNFTKQLELASFPILIANYDFKGTSLKGVTKPYKTFKKGPLKIGVFGLGIELEGLVPKTLYQTTQYKDPAAVSNEIATHLKKTEKCDLIICLSHLGFDYGKNPKIDDNKLAAQSEFIDIIIGGHTHTFLTEPKIVANKNGGQVVINQVGWAGIYLGRIDFEFENVNKKSFYNSKNIGVEKKNSN